MSEAIVAAVTPPRARRLAGSVSLLLACAMLFVVAAVVLVVPLLPGFDPSGLHFRQTLLPPFADWKHLLGTDPLGRDVLSRLAYATRVEIIVAGLAVAISAVTGLCIGMAAGWAGGLLGTALMALGNIQLSMPIILLLIVLVAALGSSPTLLVVLLGLTNWVSYGRLTRSLAISLREREFVTAAVTAGGSGLWITRKHVLPNIMHQVIVLAAFDVGVIIMIESSLSFMGLGIQPPTPSLGLMISEGQRYLQVHPSLTLCPALMIFLLISGIQFASQSLGARLSRRRS